MKQAGRWLRRRRRSANSAPILAPSVYSLYAAPGVAPVPAGVGTGITAQPRAVMPRIAFSQRVIFAAGLAGQTATLRNVTDNVNVKIYDLATEVGPGVGQVSIVDGQMQFRPPTLLDDNKQYSMRFSGGALTSWGGVPVAAVTDDSLSFSTDVAPAFIAVAVDPGNGMTYTFSGIAFPAGRVAVWLVWNANTNALPVSLTINGVVATLRARVAAGTLNNQYAFYDAVVPAGIGSVVFTGSVANGIRCGIGLWSLGQRQFVQVVNPNVANVNPQILDMNTQAGDVALFGIYDSATTPTFTPTGFSASFAATQIEASSYFGGGIKANCAGGAPEQFRYSGSVNPEWAMGVLYR